MVKAKKTKKESSPLELSHIQGSECPLIPWKNAKGVTRELFRHPSEPFQWRLSSALLSEDGPFSDYAEYDRVLCLLSGGPVVLLHPGGKKKNLVPLVPYKFSGDLPTQAQLSAPAQDFNLFLQKGKAKGAIYPTYFKPDEEYQLPLSAKDHFVYCVEGVLTVVERESGKTMSLQAGDLCRALKTGNRELPNLKVVATSGAATALWIPIHEV